MMRRVLWLLQWPYRLGVGLRNCLFDRGWKTVQRVDAPVISVGNLSVGGTGKTPCVEYVARFYREHGFSVALLSRGYGASSGRNDEAMLLEENLPDVPHFQGADRVELARIAVEEVEAEVLVLDDGFQHRRLHRDLDIVLIDATDACGNRYMLPRGTLREPMQSLKRAQLVVLTRCDRVGASAIDRLKGRIAPRMPAGCIALTKHEPLELIGTEGRSASLKLLHDRPVAAFCGIGNPEAFQQTLAGLGSRVKAFRTFPDHYNYSRDDVADLQRWASEQAADAVIATTQKDFVKLRIPDLAGRPLWAVRIGLTFIEGEESFKQHLLDALPDQR